MPAAAEIADSRRRYRRRFDPAPPYCPGSSIAIARVLLTDTDDSRFDDICPFQRILAIPDDTRHPEREARPLKPASQLCAMSETEGAMYSDIDVRNAIKQGLIPGPRLKVATRTHPTTGGYGLEGYSPEVTVPVGVQTMDGPLEARKAVREQFNYGAGPDQLVYGTDRFSFLPSGTQVASPTSAARKWKPSWMRPG